MWRWLIYSYASLRSIWEIFTSTAPAEWRFFTINKKESTDSTKKSFFSPSFKLEIFKDFLQILARLIRILKNLPCFTSLNEELREEFEGHSKSDMSVRVIDKNSQKSPLFYFPEWRAKWRIWRWSWPQGQYWDPDTKLSWRWIPLSGWLVSFLTYEG